MKKKIIIRNEGKTREWYDKDKKYHSESVLDFYVDGVHAERGFCNVIISSFLGEIKEGSERVYELNEVVSQ